MHAGPFALEAALSKNAPVLAFGFVSFVNSRRSGPETLSVVASEEFKSVLLIRNFNFSLQVNFVVCQLFALLAAVWFRTYLHSSKTSCFIRHVVATLLGLYLALFCFGW